MVRYTSSYISIYLRLVKIIEDHLRLFKIVEVLVWACLYHLRAQESRLESSSPLGKLYVGRTPKMPLNLQDIKGAN
jgi:hypothetical protein